MPAVLARFRQRTLVDAKSCGSGAARGMVVIDDKVGIRPDSVVKRRGRTGPLRGGEMKVELTWWSLRGLCWVRKKSSISIVFCC